MGKRVIIRPKKERNCTFSIRIDKDIQDAYEELSSITGYSRNELINVAMKHLLEDLDIISTDDDTKNRIAEFQETYISKKDSDY
ncbi:MAG: hypothetical protein A2Y23_03450 [Clostridiales bacterium GWB2_37_7]|nr:MAG: hypothetical protein A2Y23_03450 [Clostridiales bacterium GWB2_37_7]